MYHGYTCEVIEGIEAGDNRYTLNSFRIGVTYLAYPGSTSMGEIQIFDTENVCAKIMISAHNSPLAALAFNANGSIFQKLFSQKQPPFTFIIMVRSHNEPHIYIFFYSQIIVHMASLIVE